MPGVSPEEVERWARTELEKKFTDSMRRNAELLDVVDKLEHINVQLQVDSIILKPPKLGRWRNVIFSFKIKLKGTVRDLWFSERLSVFFL